MKNCKLIFKYVLCIEIFQEIITTSNFKTKFKILENHKKVLIDFLGHNFRILFIIEVQKLKGHFKNY